jgi:hypothetical protein
LGNGYWVFGCHWLLAADAESSIQKKLPPEATKSLKISDKSGSFKMHQKKAFKQILEYSEKFRDIFSMGASWHTTYSNPFFFSL